MNKVALDLDQAFGGEQPTEVGKTTILAGMVQLNQNGGKQTKVQ